MTGLIILLVILYIIIAVLVIIGYIFYKTRIKHERVDLSDTEEDGFIFVVSLFWPLSAIAFTFWLICHFVYTFFDWFARSLEDKEEEG